jgi:Na+-driven multidrug efflux pump
MFCGKMSPQFARNYGFVLYFFAAHYAQRNRTTSLFNPTKAQTQVTVQILTTGLKNFICVGSTRAGILVKMTFTCLFVTVGVGCTTLRGHTHWTAKMLPSGVATGAESTGGQNVAIGDAGELQRLVYEWGRRCRCFMTGDCGMSRMYKVS